MSFKVSEESIQMASSCQDNYSCLDDEERCLCPVRDAVESTKSTVIFLDTPKKCPAGYNVSFGINYHFCTCPVRLEIWKRYRK